MSVRLYPKTPATPYGPIIEASCDQRDGDERFYLYVKFQAVASQATAKGYALALDIQELQAFAWTKQSVNTAQENQVLAKAFAATDIVVFDTTRQKIELHIPSEASGLGHLFYKAARRMNEQAPYDHPPFEKSGFSTNENGISFSGGVTVIWPRVLRPAGFDPFILNIPATL